MGPYGNGGREWHPTGEPVAAKVQRLIEPEGEPIPNGAYHVAACRGVGRQRPRPLSLRGADAAPLVAVGGAHGRGPLGPRRRRAVHRRADQPQRPDRASPARRHPSRGLPYLRRRPAHRASLAPNPHLTAAPFKRLLPAISRACTQENTKSMRLASAP